MDPIAAAGFFAVMVALAAIPSASVALVVARSSSLGLLNGVATIAGIVTADIVFIVITLLGMTAMAVTMGSVFSVLKYAGGAYLVWLGIQLLRARDSMNLAVPDNRGSTLLSSYVAGFLLTLGDLKAILFYASLFPGLMDMTTLSNLDVALIIGMTVITVGGVKLAYAIVAQAVMARLRRRQIARPTKQIAGGLMVGAGGYIIFKA